MALNCHLFWLLLFAAPLLPKGSVVALIVEVNCLHQHVNGREEAGQQHMVSGSP